MNPARLREPRPHFGTWLSLGSSVVAELADASGFDWLLIDLEHGCGTEAAVLAQLQGIRHAAAIVRVGAPHPELIARVLDWGADGIMVPHVTTVAEAGACVRAAHYPPRGRRGMARTVRATGYGLRPTAADALPLLIAQIENSAGVENARAIAQVEGIDVLFVGPADLRCDLEAHPAQATRDYDACLREVAAAAAAAGRQSGILLPGAAETEAMRELGFTWLAVASDLGILRAGYRGILDRVAMRG